MEDNLNYPNHQNENSIKNQEKINQKLLKISSLIYIYLSIFCCLARCDFNVFFAFGLIIILNEFYYKNKNLYSKILFHILIILCGLDVLWIVIMLVYWNGTSSNELWGKVTGLRNFVIFISVLEVGIKVYIELMLFNDYKNENNGNIENLFKFDYLNLDNFGINNGNITAKTNVDEVPRQNKSSYNENFESNIDDNNNFNNNNNNDQNWNYS